MTIPSCHPDRKHHAFNKCRPCYIRDYRLKRPSYKQADRRSHLRVRYGLSIEDFNELLQKQNYKCAICEKQFFENSATIHIDHDHNSNRVRGLLCSGCNRGLGFFHDNPVALKLAAQYMESWFEDLSVTTINPTLN